MNKNWSGSMKQTILQRGVSTECYRTYECDRKKNEQAEAKAEVSLSLDEERPWTADTSTDTGQTAGHDTAWHVWCVCRVRVSDCYH